MCSTSATSSGRSAVGPANFFFGAIDASACARAAASGGRIVDDVDFLSLIDVSARLHGAGGDRPLVVEPGDDGRFAVNMMGPEQAGEYLLETRVWGPTFEQTLSLPLVLKHPLSVEIHPAEDGFVLWVQVSAAELDHDALRLAALVKRPPGAVRMFPLERMPAGLWKLVVPGARGLAEVTLDLKGSYLYVEDGNERNNTIAHNGPDREDGCARSARK